MHPPKLLKSFSSRRCRRTCDERSRTRRQSLRCRFWADATTISSRCKLSERKRAAGEPRSLVSHAFLVCSVRGVENGSHPIETVEEIVTQSMNAIKGMLFTEDK